MQLKDCLGVGFLDVQRETLPELGVPGEGHAAAALLCATRARKLSKKKKKPTKLSNLKITGKGKVMLREYAAQLEMEMVMKFPPDHQPDLRS